MERQMQQALKLQAFKSYPKPKREALSAGGSCSLSELLTRCASPYAIEPNVFAQYLEKAVTSVGDAAAFKYYLPSLMSLTCADGALSIQILSDKIRYANFTSWKSEEVRQVKDAFHASWRTFLGAGEGHVNKSNDWVDAFLTLFGDDDIRLMLRTWDEVISRRSLEHFGDFIAGNMDYFFGDRNGYQFTSVDAYASISGSNLVAQWLLGEPKIWSAQKVGVIDQPGEDLQYFLEIYREWRKKSPL